MRPPPLSDFYEGIRAVLIDKDHKPVWSATSLEDVRAEAIGAFFAPLEKTHQRGELRL
jgi:enoyl-CoA hydratase